MKLRIKTSIIVFLIWGAILTVFYLGSQRIILKSYINLEEQSVGDDIVRIHAAIEQMELALSHVASDWAIWDETYKFVKDQNPEYIRNNLVLGNFLSVDVDMMVFFNTQNKFLYGAFVDSQKTQVLPITNQLLQGIEAVPSLLHQPNVESNTRGLIAIGDEIYIVSARSIVTSRGLGPVDGTLVIARRFTSESLKSIQSITKVNVNLYKQAEINTNKKLQEIYKSLPQSNSFIQVHDQSLYAYSLLKDISGTPIALLQVDVPRKVYYLGSKTILYSNLTLFIYSIVLTLLLWVLLQTFIVSRIEELKKHFSNVNNRDDLKNVDGSGDEINSVASLYHQATHDPLTGLANRNLLYQAFTQFSKTQKNKILFLFLDIDYFKRINDTMGHEVGDKILIQISDHLRRNLRTNDIAVRLGGDEFVVMLVDVSVENIRAQIERIFHLLNTTTIIDGHEVHVSTSIGICVYPDDGNDVDELLKQADMALYQAKASGRNRYQLYSEELKLAIQEAHRNEIELQQAIDNRELQLHYQPIYDANTKKILSLEALVRWNHPRRGLLAAGAFIPLAEKTGLIDPIGKWVLTQACVQIKTWLAKDIPLVPVAVNISALQTANSSIQQLVTTAINNINIPANYLELELTETGFIEITPNILEELHILRDLGIQLAVDDFGAGYSGLGYLKKLPVSKLKIDQSFIFDLVTNSDDRAITLAIIAIAHKLNLIVIAEGVETFEQYEFLKQNQVDAVQGNYLSKPMTAMECEVLLTQSALIEVE